ncbi:hypothetical protein F4775DRAFT_569832, partial [Biscogniauxia sp. FL1348]
MICFTSVTYLSIYLSTFGMSLLFPFSFSLPLTVLIDSPLTWCDGAPPPKCGGRGRGLILRGLMGGVVRSTYWRGGGSL